MAEGCAFMNDIPITYINKTKENDFMVVVFAKNEGTNAINTPFVAWQTLKAQTSASFTYPINAAVGAEWTIGEVKLRAGPFPADVGTTWTFKQDHMADSPTLAQDLTAAVSPGNEIVIMNCKPRSWSGLPYTFGLYKAGKLLTTQQDVGVGSQAVFQITPHLFFGVVKDMKEGTIFKSLTMTQSYCQVNLNDFSNGLVISLTFNKSSGQYTFHPAQDGMH